ncbi:MAG: hypothetical protein JSU65_08345 [Candidatus Zixiibacteriota bacterium]|nr:MAG: hypothetical protein JSU65_08345 [candidate division Zixibacteria bacterium]
MTIWKIMDPCRTNSLPTADLKALIRKRWPRAVPSESEEKVVFDSGLPEFDALFPLGGIPYGQLIEITGSASSGKTSFLFKLLSHLTRAERAAYIDYSNNFFPSAAAAGHIDLSRLLLIKPDPISGRSNDVIKNGLRTAEILLQHKAASWLVFDLVGQSEPLPITLLHRLRLKTVRVRALTIFLTEDNSAIIPSSMASLRLEVRRAENNDSSNSRVRVGITKSRICKEGARVELSL